MRHQRTCYRYTAEQKKEAALRKNEKNKAYLDMKRQGRLQLEKLNGNPLIESCECGRLIKAVPFYNPKSKAVVKREWCNHCPLRPEYKIRTFFSKTKNQLVEYKVKR